MIQHFHASLVLVMTSVLLDLHQLFQRVAILNRLNREGLSDMMLSGQRPQGADGANPADSVLEKSSNKSIGLKARVFQKQEES